MLIVLFITYCLVEITNEGKMYYVKVVELMNGLIDKMVELPIDSRPVKYCGDVMSEYARHHLLRVLNLLLDKPLPWNGLV